MIELTLKVIVDTDGRIRLMYNTLNHPLSPSIFGIEPTMSREVHAKDLLTNLLTWLLDCYQTEHLARIRTIRDNQGKAQCTATTNTSKTPPTN